MISEIYDVFWTASGHRDLLIREAIVCIVVTLVLLAYLLIIRKYARPQPVIVGTLLALCAAGTFWWSSRALTNSQGLRLDTVSEVVKDIPPLFILWYVCYLVVRRFPGARDRRTIRRFLQAALYYLPGAGVIVLAVGAAFPYPVYEYAVPLPARSLLDLSLAIPMFVVALVLALVFIEAAGSDPPGIRRRFQSISAAVGMFMLSVIYLLTIAVDVLRVAGSPQQILSALSPLATMQNIAIMVEALGLGLAITCYCSRDKLAEFTEKFLIVTDVAGKFTRIVENAPIREASVPLQYGSLLHAAKGSEDFDFPRLTKNECSKVDDAYRIVLMYRSNWTQWCSKMKSDIADTEYLLHLTKVYDEEIFKLVRLEAELRPYGADYTASSEAPASVGVTELRHFEGLHDILKLVLTAGPNKSFETPPTLVGQPLWQQLCAVALADSGLLEPSYSADILCEDGGVVQREVFLCYFHAQNELRLCGLTSEIGQNLDRYGAA